MIPSAPPPPPPPAPVDPTALITIASSFCCEGCGAGTTPTLVLLCKDCCRIISISVRRDTCFSIPFQVPAEREREKGKSIFFLKKKKFIKEEKLTILASNSGFENIENDRFEFKFALTFAFGVDFEFDGSSIPSATVALALALAVVVVVVVSLDLGLKVGSVEYIFPKAA